MIGDPETYDKSVLAHGITFLIGAMFGVAITYCYISGERAQEASYSKNEVQAVSDLLDDHCDDYLCKLQKTNHL